MGGDRASDRILVVEDDPDARDEMARVLRSEGYDVAAAGDGEEALAELRRAAPALILLDLMMPVMDGFEFRVRQMQDRAAEGSRARSHRLPAEAGRPGDAARDGWSDGMTPAGRGRDTCPPSGA